MKLLYATSIDLPSTRANRIQIVSMAHSLAAKLGADFMLGIAELHAGQASESFCRVMGKGTSYVLAWRYLQLAKREAVTNIFCREERLLFFMVLFNQLFFHLPLAFSYELHHLIYLQKNWYRYLLAHVHGVVSITNAMRNVLTESGYPLAQTLVAPDAVDLFLFGISTPKDEARRTLNLPPDQHLVLYTGTIDEPWKGTSVLYEAACHSPETLFVLVGGKPHYVEYFNNNHPPRENLRLLGYRPHEEIPLYLRAADVVVLPNSGKEEISRISTSPMKLFEYMASGTPIVASDLPSIREILNDKNALLVLADDPVTLAQGIETLLADPARAGALAQQARADVETHTWDARATTLITWLQSL